MHPDWLRSQCGNMVGQKETGIIRRSGNHGEEDEGEGLPLVSAPSKAIDVGWPLTLNTLAYERGEPPPSPFPALWVGGWVLNSAF